MSDRKIFNDTTHGAPRDLCATAELLRKQPIIIFVFFAHILNVCLLLPTMYW